MSQPLVVAGAAAGGEERHQGEDGHDGDVLEQQHREGASAIGRAEIAALFQELQGDGGGRQGEGDADDEARGQGEAEQGAGAGK